MVQVLATGGDDVLEMISTYWTCFYCHAFGAKGKAIVLAMLINGKAVVMVSTSTYFGGIHRIRS